MSNESEPVRLDRAGAVARLHLNRPQVLNAIDEATAAAFLEACRTVAADGTVRAVVITGEGRGFMAGGDLARFRADPARGPETAGAIIGPLHAAIEVMAAMRAPVLAAVHGPVAGAGMSLAMAADLCIAADDARFTLAYARIGATPDGSGTYHLPRLVGLRKAMELALLADTIDAGEALALGLVNRVVPAAALAGEAAALAERLAAGPTAAFGRIKDLLRRSWTATLPDQLAAEEEAFRASAATADFREGVDAFFARRGADFHGR
ncbi:enoyl-CoA hydratase/isomerase family protein [Azospirillum halopraeferens]|uniref:enoyl-CoA hydratase/isomerase family protein n=1 Tax=Azospirillum halopraeferens TaxID=34010 RepID=UPI00041CD2A2|nr:enoyl-CoA hydratase-related protein [Azospirillum halopraeferens]